MKFSIKKSNRTIEGVVSLSGSKSISNRVLLIQALCKDDVSIENLSDSGDTGVLQKLLSKMHNSETQYQILDCNDAGTTFRFLTSYCALKDGEWVLTGSGRMKQRPIGDLVNALRLLGVEVRYLEKENFPPIKVYGGRINGRSIKINAAISSQFASSLLLIAPCLKDGLVLELIGDVVSQPYINLTLSVMQYFGIKHACAGNTIHVPKQDYRGSKIFIESDWSAAAFYYEMAAFANEVNLTMNGLSLPSDQGDSILPELYNSLGVRTQSGKQQVILSSGEKLQTQKRNFHLAGYPDLAPAMFATIAGLSLPASFTGLSHLAYKESHREEAMRNELAKCGIALTKVNGTIEITGRFQAGRQCFSTYNDHRMAMTLAPLAMLCGEVIIEDPMVVNKSYPEYWKHLELLGFTITQSD